MMLVRSREPCRKCEGGSARCECGNGAPEVTTSWPSNVVLASEMSALVLKVAALAEFTTRHTKQTKRRRGILAARERRERKENGAGFSLRSLSSLRPIRFGFGASDFEFMGDEN
jgi:hypothetical protein